MAKGVESAISSPVKGDLSAVDIEAVLVAAGGAINADCTVIRPPLQRGLTDTNGPAEFLGGKVGFHVSIF